MKPTSFRSLIWLTLAVFLLITACRQTSNDSAPALAPTVDIDEIAATVVAEVEANRSSSEEPDGLVKEEDSAAELAAILKQVETYLAEREERAPVTLIEEDPQDEEPDFETTLIDLYRRTNSARWK